MEGFLLIVCCITGHNGLVSAAYMAKAGMSVLVLERRHLIGGAAVTGMAALFQ